MKTIILFVTALFLSATITTVSAKTPKRKKYVNTEITETGLVKEYLVQYEGYDPMLKYIYEYDTDNNKKNVTVYKWNGISGWSAIHKYDYTFDGGRLESIVYTKWSRKRENWEKKSEITTYQYDSNGNYLAMNKGIVDYSKIMTEKQ